MGNDFMSQLQNTLTNSSANVSVTENGAVGYKTTGRKLLDMNFAVSSLRSKSENEIEKMFSQALAEDVNTAIVWLFFARDVRGGLGERRLFRICLRYLAREFPEKTRKIIPLISEYGRWDDVLCLIGTKVQADVYKLIKTQLSNDIAAMNMNQSISLLAKWLPSTNASNKDRIQMGMQIAHMLNLHPIEYQKMLSKMRKYLEIVERKMSAGEWNEINYEHVPSGANLRYNSAFLRHDEERRREYLGKLEKGEAKINSSVLFPHDIVHKYCDGLGWCRRLSKNVDPALEAMWKSIPNTVNDDARTIVVADGSGSMCSCVGGTKVTALEVANALAIYFAERLSGPYKNKYITFSSRPQLVNLAGSTSLHGKIQTALQHDEVANTNIEAVFDLILKTAVNNNLNQSDIPANILIISDMEFDYAVCGRMGANLFKQIEEKYNAKGYKIPRLVFWNVNSRTGTIPIKENSLGVALVSGFSPNVAKMVMSGALDPMDALLETLYAHRYDPVRHALMS